MAEWFLSASMDVDAEREDQFNAIYDDEHVPELLAVPGVLSIVRFRRADNVEITIGGRSETIRFDQEPRYTALYELESPTVLTTAEWATAVEKGRWPTDVRPHTRNRRHLLLEKVRRPSAQRHK